MFEYENRTLVATIVFVDIEAYSKLSVSGQMAVKTRFNEMIGASLNGVAENERILLDTGDGAALCFLGDPEHGLLSARSLHEAARHSDGTTRMALRIGINLGPIQLIKDFNGQPNVIGDAINTAQRIMSFADANHILVSRSFYELVSCLKPEYGQIFNHLGARQDKHTREHEVYAVNFAGDAIDTIPSWAETAEASLTPAPLLPDATLAKLESIFAKYIGPIAKVLVRNHSRECRNMNQLCQYQADNLSDELQRDAFLRETARMDIPQMSAPGASSSQALDPGQIGSVEKLLAIHIGPMAKFLVRRAQGKCGNLDQLCHEVAQHIENERDRNAFLAALANNTQ